MKDIDLKKQEWWRTACRVLGTIATVVPIYPPVTPAIGMALTAAADFDSNNPWGTLQQINGIVQEINKNDGWSKGAANFKNSSDSIFKIINPDNYKFNNIQDFNKYKNNFMGVANNIKNKANQISSALSQTEAPKNEIDAELARLRAEDPSLKEYTDKVAFLLAEKEELIRKINETIQVITNICNKLTQNFIAIDRLNREKFENSEVLDARVNMYLDELGNSARDRMRKYQYTMCKSYEYRMLKPYTFSEIVKTDRIKDMFDSVATTAANLDSTTNRMS
jgi:hypothetical protein